MRAVILALALLTAAGAVHAQQYYKWKGADGVTHYSKTPPPEGTQADRMAVKADAPTPVSPPAADAAGTAAAPAGGTVAQQRSAGCETARGNLSTLENNPYVSVDKNGDGQPELLTVEEHQAQLDRAREQVRTLCPAAPPAG
jgi:hypothetical protein